MPESFHPPKPVPAPLWLLVRVNALQSWRRLLSVRDQSRLLTGIIALFQAGVPSTYSKRCASDGEIGIEINSPERGLAARHLDGSTECEVNLIEGAKLFQR